MQANQEAAFVVGENCDKELRSAVQVRVKLDLPVTTRRVQQIWKSPEQFHRIKNVESSIQNSTQISPSEFCSDVRVMNRRMRILYLFRPFWIYEISLQGMTAKSHMAKLQAQRSIILALIAPWYVTNLCNDEMGEDLNTSTTSAEIIKTASSYKRRIETRINPLANNVQGVS